MINTMSHPTMGARIEITIVSVSGSKITSHPTMGAWIEILIYGINKRNYNVAPHDGCVD